ncbi:MAG: hypothetical protein JXN64_16120 [Spirochaetes bacterium]|nr:hypothetical protein [Spirochaetota bacterium]
MPDWTLIEDKDNNRFYIDRNGKIWTSGKPEFDYKPVSIEGLDYYLNHGIELIKSHNKSEGLILLKSILAMPAANDVIYKAQITASKHIKNLIKIEGTRYEDLNKNASLLLFKYNDSITLFNDDMMYRINAPVFIKIISTRTRQKLNYKYHGILLGYRFLEKTVKDKSGYSGYDLLVAIDSERFPYNLKNLNNFMDNWRMRLGNDTLERTILQKNSTYIINNYKDKYSPYYSGVEGYYIKNNYGYFLKAISSLENFRKYETEIIKVINSFKI